MFKSSLFVFIGAFVVILGGLGIFGYYQWQQTHSHHIANATLRPGDDLDTDENTEASDEYLAAVAAAGGITQKQYKISSTTPQFVLLSFDGSKSAAMLQETLDFEQSLQAQKKPLHFTYFINAVYFLTRQNRDNYQAPDKPLGLSAIGFSDSSADIATRVQKFNQAYKLGNEVGSHTAGHFSGGDWTAQQWQQEFTSFSTILADVQKNNPTVTIDTPTFLTSIKGFRAPNLSTNKALYQTLAQNNFTYDASGINVDGSWPHKDSFGVWHIPLGAVYLGDNPRPVVAMDYNLWVRQSNATETVQQGTPEWDAHYKEVETAYQNYFDTNYNGSRAPVVIAGHFSKWDDGVYWEAMKALATNVCGKPEVRCVTFSQLVEYLNIQGVPPEK